VGSDVGGVVHTGIRKTDIIWIEQRNLLTRVVQSFINDANNLRFKYCIEDLEPIQFARYKEKDFYDWHTDNFPREDSTRELNRKLSLMIQLSDPNDYDGGNLQFFNGINDPEEPDIKQQGSVIVFDSRDWHRLTPVTKGKRFSIVCWASGKKFQ
tara:strand:+ start:573 stop:1034 length:462 start_codon:yes stop_codon:yes gene_type:complete